MGQVILSHYFVIIFIDNEAGISYNYEYNEHDQVTEYTEKKGSSTRVRMGCIYDMYERPKSSTYTVNGKSYSYTCGYVNERRTLELCNALGDGNVRAGRAEAAEVQEAEYRQPFDRK